MGASTAGVGIAVSLSKWLSARRNEHVRVGGFTFASAGARRTNALFDAVTPGGTQRLALTLIPTAAIQVIDVGTEAAVRALAESAGVPVPHVHDVCIDETVIGGPFFISSAVDGETVPRRVLRLANEHAIGDLIVAQIGAAMERLHSIDPARAPDGIPRPAGTGPIFTALDVVDRLLTDHLDPSPTFAYGVRWLERHAPDEPDRHAIVHTDIRNGNLIVGPDGLRSILDWETTRVGDAMQDVAWPCQRMWRFGEDARTVGGLAAVDVLRQAYTQAGGNWDDDRFRWWRVLGTVWWGLSLAEQARAHLDGSFRSIIMAASGRRITELEYDTLLLLRPRLAR